MAAASSMTGWYKGRVKAVPSGDCLLIMANSKAELPLEKTITLSYIIAPKLARRGGIDEPFAWQSREFLRKLCIGKEVSFRVDYTVPNIQRDFGTVVLHEGNKNVAMAVVSGGWARVRDPGQQKVEENSYIAELVRLEEQAKTQGYGKWTKEPGASEKAIRDIPPSAIGDSSSFDAAALLVANKGKPLEAFVEQVRDGSTLRVYLLPEFQFVQVFVGGIQCPSMGRRATVIESVVASEGTTEETNGETETSTTLTSAQRLAASAAVAGEVQPDPFAREAKHFTEIRVLNREIRIVLEGCDKYGNLVGSVFYPDGNTAKDLALELVEHGFAKYLEWSASMLEDESKRRLKNAELQAKKSRLRIWQNYVPPPSNSKAIRDDKFKGKVIEVVSGDCVVVADDAAPIGSLAAERRVNLSSIRAPKMGNPRREKPAPYAREAKDFLRSKLIGKPVYVMMEYSRKVPLTDTGATPAQASGNDESRIMDFGSVFLLSATKNEIEDFVPSMSASAQPEGSINVAEMAVARGFASVIRHRDFEERSSFYDALLAAESRATHGKRGMHSGKEPPPMHIKDLSLNTSSVTREAKTMLPFLQRGGRHSAIVDFVLSGHRFKLLIPKETCAIAFSFSGVRCPGRDEPFADEAMSFMRRRILQRDVEVEIEAVDRTGTFLGSIWDSKTNLAIPLLEAGLAKLHSSFFPERTTEGHLLVQAEEKARKQRLKVWEKYDEEKESANGTATVRENKAKEVLKVVVTEVLGGGKFYVQLAKDQKVSGVQQQLANLNISERPPPLGGFSPKKGDLVLAQFSVDGSWNRAMVVDTPRLPDKDFVVFYIDFGNQESLPPSKLRPLDGSVPSGPGLAQLCKLAYIKVPALDEEFGEEAATFLWEKTVGSSAELTATVEERDTSGGKVKGQGTGTILAVTLVDAETETSINAAMLGEGLARLEHRKKFQSKEKTSAFDKLQEYQDKAKKARANIWQYGDVESDDEEVPPSAWKGGRR
eukprot:TRINITY_DN7610_c0_g1_i1.p1 TRINITY_DN7610_c0_g1~~TRINITY_DN7610_c0_g1_i1.p1  ORF type:complete len:993 (+),score=268.32 TRINITY_DN7610_c0_g1_i1:311-3289(+)